MFKYTTPKLFALHYIGDSGGPLFRWNTEKITGKRRSHIIGVVSRGTGCAHFNFPGIYTKVSYNLPWIYKTIGDGNC